MKKKEVAYSQEKLNKENIFDKLGGFFDRNYAIFFAPLIVIVAYIACLYVYGVFPFGYKYTVASYDLSSQICPFIEHFYDVISGKSSLFYSYAIAGGADVLGSLLYCFISPFSFLFLLFGEGMVAHAVSIIMPLKLGAIALAGTWFAQKAFHKIPQYVCVAIGVVYAYSGYTFVANTYINWLDLLIYLPFTASAFKRFVQTGSFWRFSLLMACCIYTTFSIACFSMFLVFPALIFYALLCVEKEKRNAFISRLCLSFVVAILVSLPILLPALASYMNAGRGGGLFDEFWYGYINNELGEITSFDKTAFLEKFGEAYYRKWSYVLTDGIFIALTVVWFFRQRLKNSFAKFMLVAGTLTLAPVIVDEAMLLLNMGSYMSYAYRFGFLNELFFLGGACLALEDLCWDSRLSYDGRLLAPLFKKGEEKDAQQIDQEETPKKENDGGRYASSLQIRGSLGGVISLLIVGLSALIFLFWFISNDRYKTVLANLVGDSEVQKSLASFSSRFAHSLGGIEVMAIFCVVVVAVAIFCAIMVKKRKVGLKLVSWLLIAVVGVQVLFLNSQIVAGNLSTQHTDLARYRQLCQQMAVLDSEDERDFTYNNGYFRVKDYASKVSANAPFTGRSNAYSVFSSMLDKDNFDVGQLFAYSGNLKNSVKGEHNDKKYNRGEVFGDSFMGYKYFYVPASKRQEIAEDVDMKQYVKKVMIKTEDGDQKHLSQDGYYVYENTLVFPCAYTLPRGDYRFVAPNEANSGYRKKNQLALYEFLSGEKLEGKVTVSAIRRLSEKLWTKAVKIEVRAGKITAYATATEGECLFLNFVASKGYRVYVNGKEAKLIENDIHFLAVALEEGENVVEFKYSSPYTKWIVFGALAGLFGLCTVAFVFKKTKIMETFAPIISWAGILLAVGVVAFFILFPSAVSAVKLVRLLV